MVQALALDETTATAFKKLAFDETKKEIAKYSNIKQPASGGPICHHDVATFNETIESINGMFLYAQSNKTTP